MNQVNDNTNSWVEALKERVGEILRDFDNAIENQDVGAIHTLLANCSHEEVSALLVEAVKRHRSPDEIEIICKHTSHGIERDENGYTALHHVEVYASVADFLVDSDPEILNDKNNVREETPLFCAIKNGAGSEVVEALIERGADLFCKDKNGLTIWGLITFGLCAEENSPENEKLYRDAVRRELHVK